MLWKVRWRWVLGSAVVSAQALLLYGLAFGQAPRQETTQPYTPYPSTRVQPTPSRPGIPTAATRPTVPQTRTPMPQQPARATAPSARGATPGYSGTAPAPRAAAPPAGAPSRSAAPPAQPSAAPTPQQALKLVPVQKDVDYSRPGEEEAGRCKVTAQNLPGRVGWVVEDPQGLTLRRFLDTNGDNKVDQWCYYRDGLEVYRDIDSDSNGKADQCRWFHVAGSRWGLDKDEDGTIDSWYVISPEEVAAEVVAALAQRDAARFARVLLTPAELRSLGLGEAKTKELMEKIGGADAKFRQMASQQKAVGPKTKWSQSSANQPGIVPAGTDGSAKDLQVYENVLAMVQTESEHGQVQIGTLVRVGDAWRAIDAPQPAAEGQADLAASGLFFRVSQNSAPQVAAAAGPSAKVQEILGEMEKLDAAAQAANAEQQAALNAKRADLVERLIAEATKPEDRAMWLRQLADMVSAAVQSGGYPDGAKRLEALCQRLQKSDQDRALAGYVRFRQMTAEYGLAMQAKGADFAKIQGEWLKKLEQYVTEYPKSTDAAEAMLQLAIAQEFAGQEEEAKKWYGRIAGEFPGSPEARKAAGARTRLDSVGRVISLQGKSPNGDVIDLAKYRGQVVLLQYWATTCEPCKADMAALRELFGKYGPSGFTIIGINLDSDPQAMNGFLSENRLPWPQIVEEGGRDSRPAVEFGILTLPTMILVDEEGKVINRNVGVTELSAELKKRLRQGS